MVKTGRKKITIVGAGNVGATIAYTLTLSGLAPEILLIDVDEFKAEGEAMDIMQGTAFSPTVKINVGTYKDAVDSNIVIITAGAGRKPGQTRIDLCQTNINIMRKIVPEIAKYATDAVFVVVSNPVDVLTYATMKLSGFPASRVIGSGTVLDSSRLRTSISDILNINSHDIQAYILGEHGETAMVPWSMASIAGIRLDNFLKITGTDFNKETIFNEVQKAGASVIERKGATFYAIALSVRRICEAILRDSSSVLTVSTLIGGQYGINDVCLSLPVVVGSDGVQRDIKLDLTNEEEQQLVASATALRKTLDTLTI